MAEVETSPAPSSQPSRGRILCSLPSPPTSKSPSPAVAKKAFSHVPLPDQRDIAEAAKEDTVNDENQPRNTGPSSSVVPKSIKETFPSLQDVNANEQMHKGNKRTNSENNSHNENHGDIVEDDGNFLWGDHGGEEHSRGNQGPSDEDIEDGPEGSRSAPITKTLPEEKDTSSETKDDVFEDAYAILRRLQKKGKTRKRKLAHVRCEPQQSQEKRKEEETTRCPICFDKWNTAGPHRICVLKCGHLFGKSCAEKWIRKNGTCPQCKAKARKKDIRLLFVTKILADDDSVRENLYAEKKARRKAEWNLKQLTRKYRVLKAKLEQLQWFHNHSVGANATCSRSTGSVASSSGRVGEVGDSVVKSKEDERATGKAFPPSEMQAGNFYDGSTKQNSSSDPMPAVSSCGGECPEHWNVPTDDSTQKLSKSTKNTNNKQHSISVDDENKSTKRKMPQNRLFNRVAIAPCYGSRVMEFGCRGDHVIVSSKIPNRSSSSSLSKRKPYGLNKISVENTFHSVYIGSHSKCIRDLKISGEDPDLVLTVGFDKKIVLTKMSAKLSVLEFSTPKKIWSCTWEKDSKHLFYAGCEGGQIGQYDTRKPKGAVKHFWIPSKKPIHSLACIDVAECRQGLLAASYDGAFLNFAQNQPENTGSWCRIGNSVGDIQAAVNSANYDPVSHNILVSYRGRSLACEETGSKSARHLVLGPECNGPDFHYKHRTTCTGHSNNLVMTRPALFSAIASIHGEGAQYAVGTDDSSKSVFIWDAKIGGFPVEQLESHPNHVLDVAVEPTSGILGTLSEGVLKLYRKV